MGCPVSLQPLETPAQRSLERFQLEVERNPTNADGTYEGCDPDTMARACRQFAGWKIAGNGNNVSYASMFMLCLF